MSLWKIAWRSIQQRALASSLTGISMALGVMLVVAVLVIHGVVNQSFMNNSGLGYNLVVGAKGGRLELVLNTVYYLSRPVENIPYAYYQEFNQGRFKGYVDKAIPVCLGDMYEDFRVIGTTADFFNLLDYGGKKYEFAAGRNFKPDEYQGAVIGAVVARETGLSVGGKFQPSHGVGPDAHKHDAFEVLGVLKPTGTPNDRGLFINMEGFYLIPEHARPVEEEIGERPNSHVEHAEHADHERHEKGVAVGDEDGHEHGHEQDHGAKEPESSPEKNEKVVDGHEPAHDDKKQADHHEDTDGDDHARSHDHVAHDEHAREHDHEHEHSHEPLPIAQREVTAVLVLTASVGGGFPEVLAMDLMKKVNKEPFAQAVLPIREMSSLFSLFVDPLQWLLLGLTVLIVIVSGIGILVSIYNSMSERRHEIAVIRALGGGRRSVMVMVLLESILLSLGGGLAGWIVGHSLIAAVSPWIAVQTGVSIGAMQFVGYELIIIPGLIVLASVVGYLPAVAAYRTDVAKALSAAP